MNAIKHTHTQIFLLKDKNKEKKKGTGTNYSFNLLETISHRKLVKDEPTYVHKSAIGCLIYEE